MVNRRGHGEGTIQLRAGRKKKYLAQVCARGQRVSASFETRAEARQWIQTTEQSLRGIPHLELYTSRMDKALTTWMRSHQPTWSKKTYEGYERIINQFVSPALGRKRVVDLIPPDIQQMLNELQGKISDRELFYVWQTVSAFFGFLLQQGVVKYNPVRVIPRPKYTTAPIRYLNAEQVHQFLETARIKEDPLQDLYAILIASGMREGEALGLKWSRVDWAAKSILVVEQVQWPDKTAPGEKHFIFKEPKTAYSRRRIVMGPVSMERLRAQQNRVKQLQLVAGRRWQEYDLVFPSQVGTPMEPTNMSRRFKDLLKEAGLPSIRVHDLRHTSASLLLLQGVNPKVVCERLGHSDVSTTLRLYSHVLPSLQAEAAQRMDDLLGEGPLPIPDSAQMIKLESFERSVLSV